MVNPRQAVRAGGASETQEFLRVVVGGGVSGNVLLKGIWGVVLLERWVL